VQKVRATHATSSCALLLPSCWQHTSCAACRSAPWGAGCRPASTSQACFQSLQQQATHPLQRWPATAVLRRSQKMAVVAASEPTYSVTWPLLPQPLTSLLSEQSPADKARARFLLCCVALRCAAPVAEQTTRHIACNNGVHHHPHSVLLHMQTPFPPTDHNALLLCHFAAAVEQTTLTLRVTTVCTAALSSLSLECSRLALFAPRAIRWPEPRCCTRCLRRTTTQRSISGDSGACTRRLSCHQSTSWTSETA
jgi:hypothetical protein